MIKIFVNFSVQNQTYLLTIIYNYFFFLGYNYLNFKVIFANRSTKKKNMNYNT